MDVVKLDPLTAAEKYVEVSRPDAENLGRMFLMIIYRPLPSALILVIVPIKISVLLFYKRIFATQLFKRCTWVTISIVLAWGVGSLVVCSDRSISAPSLKLYFTKDG